jgi:hypothetical protein
MGTVLSVLLAHLFRLLGMYNAYPQLRDKEAKKAKKLEWQVTM